MEDFLKFKKMITPLIIQIIFWIGVVVVVITGIGMIIGGIVGDGGGIMVLTGLFWILIGPIVARIYCEILIVIFSINDTLTEVKTILRDKPNV